jgi:REP-associated tyrosine transposase
MKRRGRSQALDYDFGCLVDWVSELLQIDSDKVPRAGRYPETVAARSVLCYWAAREMGISTLELQRRLGIFQPSAIQSVKRGEKLVTEKKRNRMGRAISKYQYPSHN